MNNKSFGKLLSALIKFHHSIWGQSPSFGDTDLLNPTDYNQHFLCISQHAFAATCTFTLGIIVTPLCCKSFSLQALCFIGNIPSVLITILSIFIHEISHKTAHTCSTNFYKSDRVLSTKLFPATTFARLNN